MADIFGNTRKTEVQKILTSEVLTVNTGSSVALGAGGQFSYRDGGQLLPIFGGKELYYVAGAAQGSLTIQAMVGSSWFPDLSGGECVNVLPVTLGTNGSGQCDVTGASLRFSDAVFVGVGGQWSTGSQPVMSNADFLISSVSR
jgi:hypothetical protein